LAPRFFGPYKIIQRIGEVAYKLQLPTRSIIHPIFHVSQLKMAIGNYEDITEFPVDLEGDKGEILPERPVSWRDSFDAGQQKRE